jgi:predicted nucleotide-binding protein
MAERRPSVFIGSFSEGLPVAEAIQVNLDQVCEVVVWSQGIFGLSQGTLENLVDKADEFDLQYSLSLLTT